MPIRKSRFPKPPNIKGSKATAPKQYSINELTGGLNKAQPIYDLAPGETPQSQNFTIENGFLLPRSGFSRWIGGASFLSSDVGLVAFNSFSNNTEYAYAGSAKTFQLFDGSAWNLLTSKTTISSSTTGYYSAAEIFNADGSGSIPVGPVTVFTNHQNYPFFHSTEAPSSALSNVPGFHSLASFAEYVAPFDNRLVFFNVSAPASGATRYPHRVVWSARGAWSAFTNGGGFEDLADMQGPGTGLVSLVDRMVLTSSEQVWAATPRRDSYAFDFYLLDPTRGCPYPRTLKATEAGAVWLGAGYQMYRLVGNQIQRLGLNVERHLIDTVREPTLLHASYNPDAHTYNLFYSDTTGEYPSRYLQLYLDQLDRGEESRAVFLDQTFGSIASITTIVEDVFELGGYFTSGLTTWAAHRDGEGTLDKYKGDTDVRPRILSSTSTTATWERFEHAIFVLDNTAIPSDASIISRTLGVLVQSAVTEGPENPEFTLSKVNSSATSWGDMAFSDVTYTEWASSRKTIVLGSKITFSMNTLGIGDVSGNDYTQVALLAGDDLDNTQPSASTVNYAPIFYGTAAAAANRPRTAVVYQRDLTREISVADRYNGSIYAVGEDGIAYRQLSAQTDDDGVAIDARWRTGAISDSLDLSNNFALTEAWLGARQSASTATVGLYASYDESQNFSSIGTFVLSTLTPVVSLPVAPTASRAPQVELRINDGSRPALGRLQLNLRSYSGRRRG